MLPWLLEWIESGELHSRAYVRFKLGAVFDWAMQNRVAEESGILDQTLCPECWRGHRERIRPAPAGWRLFCEDDRWVDLCADDVAGVRAAPAMLASALTQAMRLPGKPQMREPNRLWQLGDLDIRGRPRTIFFARKTAASTDIDEILSAANSRGSQRTGAILTSGPAPPAVRTQSRHRFIPLIEVSDLGAAGFSIFVDAIGAWLEGSPVSRNDPAIQSRSELRKTWITAANTAWDELDASGRLDADATKMGDLVEERLLALRPKLSFVPKPKVITGALRLKHRAKYPH